MMICVDKKNMTSIAMLYVAMEHLCTNLNFYDNINLEWKERIINMKIDRFLKVNRDYFENHNYKVYFTGARYEYKGAFQNVQANELMIAIKEE